MKFFSFARLFRNPRQPVASSRKNAARQQRGSRPAKAARLALEALEDRTLMAVLPVPTVTGHFDNLSLSAGNHSAPAVAVDPLNPNDLVAVYVRNDPKNLPAKTPVIIEGQFSIDGGKSWSFLSLPFNLIDPSTSGMNIAPFLQETDPSVAFDLNHNFYIVYAEHNGANAAGAIVLQKFSDPKGTPVQTLTDNIVYEWIQDPAFNPVVTIDTNPASFTDPTTGNTKTDPYSGTVYVAWSTVYVPPTGAMNFNPNSIKVVSSSNGGRNFSSQVYVNDGNFNFGSQHFAAPQLAVSGGTEDGRVSPGQLSIVYDDFNSGNNVKPIPVDFLNFNSVKNGGTQEEFQFSGNRHINDAFDPGNGLPHIPGQTDISIPVNVPASDTTFTAVTKLNVELNLHHASLDQLQIELIRPPITPMEPESARTLVLVFARTNSAGTQNAGTGISGANLGETPAGVQLDTIFDDDVPRSIFTGSGAAAPFTGQFQPEEALAFFKGLTRAQIKGNWILRIFDTRSNQSNGADPVQFVRHVGLLFNSGLTTTGGSFLAETPVRGALTSPFPLKPAVAPDRGIGPEPVIASDNTLGSFSPNQGNLYVAYTDKSFAKGDAADHTVISLLVSKDGGATWSFPVQVNDDNATTDGFSEAGSSPNPPPNGIVTGRPHFEPAVAVDQSTGTLVVTFYDARQDASRSRVARYIATSLDGGQTFGPETYLNTPEAAFDEITRQTVNLGPIPDNASGGNPNKDALFGFGDREGLAVANGQVFAAWSGNLNGGTDGKKLFNILSATATIAAGPRVIGSTMGPVAAPLNATLAADGTRLADTLDVTFDRPVDPDTFTTSQVAVVFRSATGPANQPGISLDIVSVTPLDLGPLGATQFQVKFDPTNAFAQTGTYVGTYSYSIGPDVEDRIRRQGLFVLPTQVQTFSATPNLRVPPVGTGGTGDPNQDVTNSTINVAGIPAGQLITNVNVTLDITHTFDSDLVISLIAPDGTSILLANREGFGGQNFTATTFSDRANQAISQGTPPFNGTFTPEELLGLLNGKDANGMWTLRIDDTQAADIGTLNSWSLQIETGVVHSDANNITLGNPMDQNANGRAAEIGLDAYAVPRPLNGTPFVGPYDAGTLPLIVPGPHVVGSSVPGNAATTDNLVLNGTVSSFNVVFDRNMDPTTVTTGQILRFIGPAGLIGPGGAIPASFSITADPTNSDPDHQHPRTYRINFLTPDGTKPLALELNGTYTLVLGAGIKSQAGDPLDTNQNAGLDLLRGTPSAGTSPVAFSSPDTPLAINSATPGTPATSAPGITDSTITVSDNFFLLPGSVTVSLDIAYPHDPDLEVDLIAPTGKSIRLFANIGTNGNQANFHNTVLDDATSPTLPVSQGSPPFTGRFNPQQPLNDLFLNGPISASGKWTLRIINKASGTTGTLKSWTLTLLKPRPLTGLGEPVADQAEVSFRIFTMDPANPLSRNTWTSVGPGQNGTGHGRVGGIAVDPSDPSGNTVYIAGASGGVWKTTNFLTSAAGGPTYVPLTDFGPTFGINIGGLAVFGRNNDPTQSIVFAATGEGDTGTTGVGFLRSMDGGATWTLLDSTTNVDANGNPLPLSSNLRDHMFVGTHAFKVLADPRPTPSGEVIVYAALTGTNGGIWRSTDTGKHWTLMRPGQATDLVFDPNSGHVNAISNPTGNLDVLYGAFRGDGVYQTPNRGQVWQLLAGTTGDPLIQDGDNGFHPPVPVTAGPTPNGANGRIVLAKPELTGVFLPDGTYTGNPTQDLLYEGWLYAGVMTTGGHLQGLYLTKDFGQNWTKIRIGTVATPNPLLQNAIPTNDSTQPDYDVGGKQAAQGNYDFSLGIDPTNPNIAYLGGTADFQPTGFIRVDSTGLSDPHAFLVGNDENDGGTLRIKGTDPVALKNWPDNPGFFMNPVDNPTINLIRDPTDPFAGNATFYVSNAGSFTNTGTGARWIPFDLGGTDQHRIVTMRDPLTGRGRLIIGDDQGVFSAIDINGTLSSGIANEKDPEGSTGGAADRNGNLAIAQFYYGAAQPSSAAAQVAGALFYSGVQDGASDQSAPDVLNTGNLTWTNPDEGDGGGVATDQTGKGTVYKYIWPCCGGNITDFFQVNYTGRTFGLVQQSSGGIVPDPQWPFTGVANFAVNPIDGDQAIISSFAGRVFGTADQGRTWLVIGDPAALDSTQSLAMAFGAPDPADPSGALNDFLYAGTNGGHVFVTFTGGGANGNQWINLDPADLDGSAIQAIVTNPTRGSHEVYVVTSNNVYHMADSKVSATNSNPKWQKITGNLFALTHNVLTPFNDATQLVETQARYLTSLAADYRYAIPDNAVELNNPSTPPGPTHPVLYVGGEGGVYRSVDGGTTWTIFPNMVDDGSKQNGGYLPNAHVTDLKLVLGNINPTTGHPIVVDPNTGAKAADVLYATTYGRGAFAIRVAPVIVNGSLQLDPLLPPPIGSNPGPINNTTKVLQPIFDGMSEQSAFNNVVKIELFDITDPNNPVNVGVDPNDPTHAFVTTDANGRFKIQLKAGYFKADGTTDGLKVFGIRPTDAVGAVGNIAPFTFTLDTTPLIHNDPLHPIHLDANGPLPANQGGSDSGLSVPTPGALGTFQDQLTNVTQPIIDGLLDQAAPTTVNITDTSLNGSPLVGTGTTDANGNFSIQVFAGIYKNDGSSDGLHTLQIVAPHGGSPSNVVTFQFTLDTQAPATPGAPTLSPQSDSGVSNSDGVTNVQTPTFTGKGEPRSQVQLFANNLLSPGVMLVGTDIVNTQGNYTVQATTPLADGVYDITVRLSDLAGNLSPFSAAAQPQLTINTHGPTAPTITLDPSSNTGPVVSNNFVTAAVPQVLDGTADPGTFVAILDNGTTIVTFTQGSGNTFAQTVNLATGVHNITVTSSDNAGNTSTSGVLTITIDPQSLDADHKFIRQIYFNELGRTGSLPEWNLWIPLLASGPNGRQAVVSGIARAGEARDRLVKSWYVTYLGRQAGAGEEQPWVTAFLQGAAEEQVLAAILATGEYFNHAPAILGVTDAPSNQIFVRAIFGQLLHRAPNDFELNGFSAAAAQLGRQAVAGAILVSAEYRRDFVISFYIDLLHRQTVPSDQELNNWVFSQLLTTDIRVGFESSVEFFFRVTGFLP